jgi:RNA polymerase sigma-70 factor (ECF subfamily)
MVKTVALNVIFFLLLSSNSQALKKGYKKVFFKACNLLCFLTNTVYKELMAVINEEELRQLSSLALKGEAMAYKQFLSLVSEKFRRRITKILPSNLIEDTLQESLLAVHKSLHTLDPNKAVTPWLNAICHYKIQDQLRAFYKNASTEVLNEEMHGELDTSLEAPSINMDDIKKHLNERELEIFKLIKIEEESVLDVSKKTGLSPSNVKVIAFRATQKLRFALAKEGAHEQ